MITSVFRRLWMALAVLVGGFLLSGCSGEENIQLPKKIDFVLDAPPKDYKEKRPAFAKRGSAKIKGDPSGVNPNRD